MNKMELLGKLRAARASWDETLAQAPEDWMREPGVDGEWSIKDIISHVSWSEREIAQMLETHSMAKASDLWALPRDERNSIKYEQDRERDLDEVLEDARTQYSRLLAAIEGLAEADLHDPSCFAGMPANWVPWQVIVQRADHYAAHTPAIRAWLDNHEGIMLPHLRNKSEIQAALAAQREHWQSVLSSLDAAQMEQPGVMGEWSFKDMMAHLTGWRKRTAVRLEAALYGGEPALSEWPANVDDDEINNWMHDQSRIQSLRQVLNESGEVLDRVQAAVDALSEEDLMTPGRYSWLDGQPLVVLIHGTLDHYYGEHGPSLRAVRGW